MHVVPPYHESHSWNQERRITVNDTVADEVAQFHQATRLALSTEVFMFVSMYTSESCSSFINYKLIAFVSAMAINNEKYKK